MLHGVVIERHEGTAQGGPLSPLLANLLLDEVDKELERRGHAFVRYADDCNVYVRSHRAGQRVLAWLRRKYSQLHLRLNEHKSAVDWASKRKFLGFSFWFDRSGAKRRIAPEAIASMKQRVRQITRRSAGKSLAQVIEQLRGYLLGWKAYFSLAQTPGIFADLDGWIRHRLRALQLKHWRRGTTAYQEARRLGASEMLAGGLAANLRRWWHNAAKLANSLLRNRYFDQLGLPKLAS